MRDLKFGYWGRLTDLEKMKSLLDPKIDKNSRFLSLGTQPWNKILAYSPAEPGLSAFLEYENVISMGGWSDLHPNPSFEGHRLQKCRLFKRENKVTRFLRWG
jgi:hypothetical protein